MAPPTIERFALGALPPRPWKNGGGTTREIAAAPPGAGVADFDWRVSVAEIASDGPFSAFPGVDRQIVLLEGAGVRLRGARFDRCLDRPLEPFAFAGEEPVEASLLGGPSRDLNVMTRRGAARAELRVVAGRGDVPACDALVLLAVGGAFRAGAFELAAGEGLVARGGAPALAAEACGPGGALIVILIFDEIAKLCDRRQPRRPRGRARRPRQPRRPRGRARRPRGAARARIGYHGPGAARAGRR